MDMSPQEYQAYIKQKSPKSPIWKDTALAFLIGGAICVLGQLILDGYRSLGLDKTDAGTRDLRHAHLFSGADHGAEPV
ncbi:MAG: SpoVA/SpoVAEb family sporulation membrane protein [Oscillospiraceae bacterium]